jgi:hypothetical protein
MAETDKPWMRWEYKNEPNGGWRQCGSELCFYSGIEYRRKPRVIAINGIEVPEPLREKPEIGVTYWYPCITYRGVLDGYRSGNTSWDDDTYDNQMLDAGLIHLTKEAAELHAKALLSFTKK